MDEIAHQLDFLMVAKSSLFTPLGNASQQQQQQQQLTTNDCTPLKAGAIDDDNLVGIGAHTYSKSRTPTTLVKHQSPTAGSRTPTTGGQQTNGNEGNNTVEVFDFTVLKQSIAQLRAVIFVVSPHPTMRRVVLSEGTSFVTALAHSLNQIQLCRKYVKEQQQDGRIHRKPSNDGEEMEILQYLKEVEVAVLGTLETISQVHTVIGNK